jgi:hypothetical protein
VSHAFAASWWLQVGNEAARCKGPAKDRADGRCHNLAREDGLCWTHLRMAGKLRVCGVCGRPASRENLSDHAECVMRALNLLKPAG